MEILAVSVNVVFFRGKSTYGRHSSQSQHFGLRLPPHFQHSAVWVPEFSYGIGYAVIEFDKSLSSKLSLLSVVHKCSSWLLFWSKISTAVSSVAFEVSVNSGKYEKFLAPYSNAGELFKNLQMEVLTENPR